MRHRSILPAAERFASLARLTVTMALLSVASKVATASRGPVKIEIRRA
jgi:hypothetical protein